MKRVRTLLLIIALLPVLGGCPQVGTIRITEDTPADLDTLIADNEYSRVRQLTGKYPALDSAELQYRLQRLERDYESATWTEANRLESADNLHEAVQTLSVALQKIPHSNRLRDLRNSIEQKRVRRLRNNERATYLARGHYLKDQLRIFDDNNKLEPPTRSRQLAHKRNQSEAAVLAGQLITHARFAMDEEDLSAAMTCLELSGELHDSPEAASLRSELQAIRNSLEKNTQQKASIKKAQIKRKQTIKHREQTEILLTETREALQAKKLHVAREAFNKIPSSRSGDEDVIAVRTQLEQAVKQRVDQLITSGDALYRAERINPALREWNEALRLSPDNQEIRERTERANKVLARLAELKSKQ